MPSLRAKPIKKCLVLVSIIFWITGQVLIFFGAGLWKYFEPAHNHVEKFFPLVAILIAIGFLVNCLAPFAFIETDRRIILPVYSILGGVVLAELVVVCLALNCVNRPEELIKDGFHRRLAHFNDTKEDQHSWHTMQTRLACCGVDNYADWYPVLNTKVLPESCCSERSEEPCSEESQGLHRLGCLDTLQTELSYYLNWILWGMCVIAVVQAFCIWRFTETVSVVAEAGFVRM